MPYDPFDRLLSRWGENLVWCAVIAVVCVALVLTGVR
jgi:hypothetical protein